MHRVPSLAIGALILVLVAGSGAAEPALPGARDFGASPTLTRTTPLRSLLAEPEKYRSEPVLLRGRLTDLCTKKGCWTVLADGDATLRVRFRDYGFFLPGDALGATALVQGVTSIRTLSEREARHIASESRGGDPDAVQGPQRELGFVASGVRLLPPTAASEP